MKLKADESSEPWELLAFSGKNTENVGRTKWEKDVLGECDIEVESEFAMSWVLSIGKFWMVLAKTCRPRYLKYSQGNRSRRTIISGWARHFGTN